MKRPLKILGSGKYLPGRIVESLELDRINGLKPGSNEGASGVARRRYVSGDETNSLMGARALEEALRNSKLNFEDLDALIYASGTIEQSIPCTSALIQKFLGKTESGIPSFDVNSTCLSFVTAIDLASCLLEANRYRRIAIVSSEIASIGLDYSSLEASALFGDGAAAFIVERTPAGEGSGLRGARMETFAKGADVCRITGGGTRIHPRNGYDSVIEKDFLFFMDGKKIFKLVLETMVDFVDRGLGEAGLKMSDFKLVVPHQASASGMELMRRRLGIETSQWIDILKEHGNMIAASIPLALHMAIEDKRIARGDLVLLIGTSAGVSLGMVALEY